MRPDLFTIRPEINTTNSSIPRAFRLSLLTKVPKCAIGNAFGTTIPSCPTYELTPHDAFPSSNMVERKSNGQQGQHTWRSHGVHLTISATCARHRPDNEPSKLTPHFSHWTGWLLAVLGDSVLHHVFYGSAHDGAHYRHARAPGPERQSGPGQGPMARFVLSSPPSSRER
jgi:hypothetical protein